MACRKPTGKTHTISKRNGITRYKRHEDGKTIVVKRKSKNK